MNHQLALAIQCHQEATFQDFCWGQNSQIKHELCAALAQTGEQYIYLWGARGCGKSHLLQACCQHLGATAPSIYLPLKILKTWDTNILNELTSYRLFCVDDLDSIANHPAWEEALFHLYNRIRENTETTLIIAGLSPPTHTAVSLPDLKSRLSSGLIMHINELSDTEKAQTLSLEAHRRGFELSQQVAQFLVNRSPRNMHDLRLLLDKLDDASLAAQRKITIPFVKSILNW